MGNIRETFRDYCQQKQGVKFPDNSSSSKEKKSKKEYMHDYYMANRPVLQTYQRCYYEKNKERLLNKLTKFQTLVYNHYLQKSNASGLLPPLQQTAIDLGKTTAQIFRATEALVRKGKLVRVPEGYRIKDWVPSTIVEPLFDANEPDLYEVAESPEEIIKRLQDENDRLHTRLHNAEDRYLKVLGEYTEYKNAVQTAYDNFKLSNDVNNSMISALYNAISKN